VNTGKRTGEEVIQMYVKHLDSHVMRPLKELVGFTRVTLKPNEKRTITMALPAERIAYWDESAHSFKLEGNRIQIMVGPSSADSRLQTTVQVNP
jgi:beta-glucosidase